MNERIIKRNDRKGRFGDIRVVRSMDGLKLGRRDCSQCERLFLLCMESIHNTILNNKKGASPDTGN